MAQIKRKKVSRSAVKGQKKEHTLLRNKKFWIILSSAIVGAAIIGVGIWLIVYFTTQSNTKDNPDFFGKSTEYVEVYKDKTNNEAIQFKKMSYDGVLMHTYQDDPKVYDSYMFVFAANLSTFYVDNTINSGKDTDDSSYVKDDEIKAYKELYRQLAFLEYSIEKYNKDHEEKVSLYIVDTSISDNVGFLTDLSFGGSDEGAAVSFCLYSFEENIKFADEDEQKKIFCQTVSEVTNTGINNAYNLMMNGFVLEENKN